jgi:quercetin dioxygenase-like cupin family protein
MPHMTVDDIPAHPGLFPGTAVRVVFGEAGRGGEVGAASARIVLGVITLQPGATIPPHQHDIDEAFYVLEGSGIASVGANEFQVSTGDALLSHAGELHGFRNESSHTVRLLFVYPGTDVKAEYPGLAQRISKRASRLF